MGTNLPLGVVQSCMRPFYMSHPTKPATSLLEPAGLNVSS